MLWQGIINDYAVMLDFMGGAHELMSLKFDDPLGLRDRVMLHFLIWFAPRTSELTELTLFFASLTTSLQHGVAGD
ncbi:site-specific recombinase XerC [Alicyclobacillus cycloheptanicus]|uniref:Site-specific recombinase XerC n=1 Tax=Alicyclobacillus cycloheptanicus TaxID=1457 RepID=A0ABT9XMJ8_9BACL|nr:site-specific recombinase XerC [Alicyclobacillus cycloheptanicus]